VDLLLRGIASVTVHSLTVPFTSEQATMKPDLGDVFGVVDAEVCGGPHGSSTNSTTNRGLSAFAVVLSDASTASSLYGNAARRPIVSDDASHLSANRSTRGFPTLEMKPALTPSA